MRPIIMRKSTFVKRSQSIKNIKNGNYNDLARDFLSYGKFINFCIGENILISSKVRRGVMNECNKNKKPV